MAPLSNGNSTVRILLIAIAAVLIAACSRQTGEGVALPVVNGDFEQASADGSIPGWWVSQHAGPTSYTVSLDNEMPGQGKRSVKITRTQPQVYGSITQDLPLKGYAGKTVRVTARMKSEGVGPRGWCLFLSAHSLRTNIYGPPLTGTTPWKEVSAEVKIAPGVDLITFGASLRDGGTGWLDDVHVYVID